jgi:hypothetical protein
MSGVRRLIGLRANARRIDQERRLGQLGLDDRLVPGQGAQVGLPGGPIEVRDDGLRPVEVAVEHRNPGQAGLQQDRDHRPGTSTGSQNDRLAGPSRRTLGQDGLQAGADAGRIGVVAMQPSVAVDDHAHRATGAGLVGQQTDERRGLLLVRRPDHRAHDVRMNQLAQGLGQLVPATLPALDLHLATGSRQRRPLDRLGGSGRDGGADDE